MAENYENNEPIPQIEDNHSVHNENDDARNIHYDNPPVRTLHDYLHPTRRSVPSCIIFPMNDNNFNSKLAMIQLLPSFMGMESPHKIKLKQKFREEEEKSSRSCGAFGVFFPSTATSLFMENENCSGCNISNLL